jgi:uncharacterized protein (TIGR03437 family)
MAFQGLRFLSCAALLGVVAQVGYGHAIPTPIPQGALRARGNRLVDASGQEILLRGVVMPGLEKADPKPADLQTIAAMNRVTFGILRQRWNMNAVRLPVGRGIWQRDGQAYLDRVAQVVRLANDAGLVVILAAVEDTDLPSPELVTFWRIWATAFRDNPKVIFSVFRRPSVAGVPGRVAGRRSPSDWQFWLRGGVTTTGRRAVGMQDLVEAIRSTGASQVLAIPAFHDDLGFQGFAPDFYISDPNILYEVHPYYDVSLTNTDRTEDFGFLAGRFPVYAGEWGLTLPDDQPTCRSFPSDLGAASQTLIDTLLYFDSAVISWTAFAFQPPYLIEDFTSYAATRLDRPWTCGQVSNPEPGMGEYVLVWLTGDQEGFGSLSPSQIANAAGGPASPAAPGQILSIYGFLFGPEREFPGRLDSSGLLATDAGEMQVLFDGVAAPLFHVGPYQINVQVPFSVAGKSSVNLQAFFRGLPSNIIKLQIIEAAPGIFAYPATSDAIALNQDGRTNSFGEPAETGAIVVLYATGGGQTSPPGVSGKPAQSPYPRPVLPVSVTIDGRPAEILYAGEAPGFVGLLQINARIPPPAVASATRTLRSVAVILRIGDRSSLPRNIWVTSPPS